MRKKTLAISAIFLCLLLISMVSYIPVTEAIVPLVILAIGFCAGAITAALIGYFMSTTTYEYGADQNSYLSNIMLMFDKNFQDLENQYENDLSMLSVSLKYYWYRQAEAAAQYYLSEEDFPENDIWIDSGIHQEWINFTSTKSDMIQQNLDLMNNYFNGDFTEFVNLDIKYPLSGANESLKDESTLKLYSYIEDESSQFVYIGNDLNEDDPAIFVNIDSGIANFTVYNSDEEIVYYQVMDDAVLADQIDYVDSEIFNHLTVGETYSYAVNGANEVLQFCMYLPQSMLMVPSVLFNEDHADWGYKIVDDYLSGYPCFIEVRELYAYNETSELMMTLIGGASDSLTDLIGYFTCMQQSALNAAEARWTYLKALGYNDIEDIPDNMIIPSVTIVNIAGNQTDALTPEQWQILYYSYLQNLERFFNSTEYQNSGNLTGLDFNIPVLDLTFNATVYQLDGEEYLKETHYPVAFLPTSSLTLIKNQNVTLTKDCDMLSWGGYYEGQYFGGDIPMLRTLNAGDMICVHNIYRNGTESTSTTAGITIASLTQRSIQYDFELTGTPTTATTTWNWLASGSIPILIVLAIGVVLLMNLGGGGRRRRYR